MGKPRMTSLQDFGLDSIIWNSFWSPSSADVGIRKRTPEDTCLNLGSKEVEKGKFVCIYVRLCVALFNDR